MHAFRIKIDKKHIQLLKTVHGGVIASLAGFSSSLGNTIDFQMAWKVFQLL